MTTSSSSANATGLSDRRRFISTLTAASALGMTAMPALASEPGPIERMYPEHVLLSDALDAAIEARLVAEERYQEPPRPLWHPLRSAGGYRLEDLPGQPCRCCLDDSDKNVAALKVIIATPFTVDTQVCKTEAMHQAGVDRAKDTLAQIDEWKAEAESCSRAAGLTEALEAERRAAAAAQEHAAELFAIEPSTFREVAFQAAVLELAGWDDDQVLDLLTRLTDLADIGPARLDA